MNTSTKSHVELLGWINIVSGALTALSGALVGLALIFLAPVPERQAAVILLLVAVVAGGLLGVMAICQVIVGLGLLKHKSWSRLLALVVAVFALFSFPIGTAIAIYAFWVLTKPEASQLLANGT